MSNQHEAAIKTIEGWLEAWRDGDGSQPFVCADTLGQAAHPLEQITSKVNDLFFDIRLTYSDRKTGRQGDLFIFGATHSPSIRQVTANVVHFRAEGRRGCAFRGKHRPLF